MQQGSSKQKRREGKEASKQAKREDTPIHINKHLLHTCCFQREAHEHKEHQRKSKETEANCAESRKKIHVSAGIKNRFNSLSSLSSDKTCSNIHHPRPAYFRLQAANLLELLTSGSSGYIV